MHNGQSPSYSILMAHAGWLLLLLLLLLLLVVSLDAARTWTGGPARKGQRVSEQNCGRQAVRDVAPGLACLDARRQPIVAT
jgi:hypothetical protein